MKTIDERKLESELPYRFQYLTEFMGFGESDIAAIHGSAAALSPLVPALVDAVYAKLYSYTSTWRHFVPRQDGYDGEVPADLAHLTPDHPQIAFRKQHLSRYLVALVTKPYDAKMLEYLDMVGKIHTDQAGSKQIVVPLVQMNALMGFVADAFVATILSLNLPRDTETATLRAFNRLLWLQNDLISRHYCRA
jgi:Protoglobin